MKSLNTKSLKETRKERGGGKRTERGNDLCPPRLFGVDLSTVTPGLSGEYAAYEGLCVFVHVCTHGFVCVVV